ncbi:hypothetical protein QJS04_geneDACA023848 [Acorus gramineus]|uniref:CASP-like protein n=1 Tax=Acorus gramineus TaxID=55184 RepID=A0AAV9BNY1_ACOGR|nr:hypothetical protein QJS04_geneDACA023848 [Acorus gramineus]
MASLLVMSVDVQFYSYTTFCFLVTIMGLVIPWSSTLALVDIYSIFTRCHLHQPGVMVIVVIGDWVLALLSLAAASASASVVAILTSVGGSYCPPKFCGRRASMVPLLRMPLPSSSSSCPCRRRALAVVVVPLPSLLSSCPLPSSCPCLRCCRRALCRRRALAVAVVPFAVVVPLPSSCPCCRRALCRRRALAVAVVPLPSLLSSCPCRRRRALAVVVAVVPLPSSSCPCRRRRALCHLLIFVQTLRVLPFKVWEGVLKNHY